MRRLGLALAFGGFIAGLLTWIGTRDLENYETAFFSLDRGTAVESVRVLGHPVYTLAVGFGVRLPLHASLGASPAAAIAPYVPAPITYWLLLTLAIGAATLIVHHALEPLSGRVVPWIASVLLFWSVPMVSYTIYNDWPEAATTYCAVVAAVFAPQALLALLGAGVRRRSALSLVAVIWALIALAHPGYWPLIAMALVAASALALWRFDHPWRARFIVVCGLGLVSVTAVALPVADIVREVSVLGADASVMTRLIDPAGSGLIATNLFPFAPVGSKVPFTFLVLACCALAFGLRTTEPARRSLIAGGVVASIAFGILSTTVAPGAGLLTASNVWSLRDPAIAFAVLGAAAAAGALRWGAHRFATGVAMVVLSVAALQGPLFATWLVRANGNHPVWTRDMRSPAARLVERGIEQDRLKPGERVALWPGVRKRMRDAHLLLTDFADAGSVVVTAGTKQRTMRTLVTPNDVLFNQSTDLSAAILCDAATVRFLHVRYLLRPADAGCPVWEEMPGVLVDEEWHLAVSRERDERVGALPVARLAEPLARAPALGAAGSPLISNLTPLDGTSLRLGPRGVELSLLDPAIAAGRALVLPVAYDHAWRASSGRVINVGGFIAVTGVDQRQVTLEFAPDAASVLHALSMTLAQVLGVLGLVGLGAVKVFTPGQREIAPVP